MGDGGLPPIDAVHVGEIELHFGSDRMMRENACYGKPFLKEVIVRVDFASPVDRLAEKIPAELANVAVTHFPISEPRAGVAREVQFAAGQVLHKKRTFTEWNYYGREREKRLAIGAASVFASVKRYTTFEDLKADFLHVLDAFRRSFPDVRASRTGLRYINHVEPDTADIFDWHEYITPGLLGILGHFPAKGVLTRAFNIVELKYDEIDVKFQFGMPNPDFPAPIRRPFFVLDLDGYSRGLQDLAEVVENIDKAHAHVQGLFEDSITDRLREVMDAR